MQLGFGAATSTTPPPQMKSGLFADRSSFAASSIVERIRRDAPRGKGAERRIGPHVAALDRRVLHVERQRDVRRARDGRWSSPRTPARNVRGMSAARSSTAFHLVSGFISARWSSSVSVKRFLRGDRDVGIDREDRDRGLVRLDQARQDVGRAAARRPFAHADLAGDPRIAVGHVGGVALVARQDVPHRSRARAARRRAAGWCRRTARRSPRRRARLQHLDDRLGAGERGGLQFRPACSCAYLTFAGSAASLGPTYRGGGRRERPLLVRAGQCRHENSIRTCRAGRARRVPERPGGESRPTDRRRRQGREPQHRESGRVGPRRRERQEVALFRTRAWRLY